jgi:hypothetical protein
MSRKTRPRVDGLENKTLLSGLAVSLTTDKSSYQPGRPISMKLTETNMSNQPITIADGPSIDGFFVTHDDVTVWASNEGPVAMYLAMRTLQPGQSFSLNATWNGIQDEGPPVSSDGVFVVHNQLAPNGPTATITLSSEPQPRPVEPQPKPAQPLLATLEAEHSSYKRGQNVSLTLVERNVGSQDLAVASGRHIVDLEVTRESTVVWRTPPSLLHPTGRQTLHAGQSRTLKLAWNGKVNLPRVKIIPGTYTLTATVDGVTTSKTIQVR